MAQSNPAVSNVRPRLAWWLALAVLVLGGSWLRYRDVTEQVLGGDEFHAIHVAHDHGLAEILTYYAPADNSVVLTLYARVLMDTVRLTELNYR